MKTFIQLLSYSSLLAVTSAAAAAAPAGYINTYTVPECTKTSAGGIVVPKSTTLASGKCINISPIFTSFTAGVTGSCPKGTVPIVLAYPGADCKQDPVSSGTLPSNGAASSCKEIVVDLSNPAVGGGSAKFGCL